MFPISWDPNDQRSTTGAVSANAFGNRPSCFSPLEGRVSAPTPKRPLPSSEFALPPKKVRCEQWSGSISSENTALNSLAPARVVAFPENHSEVAEDFKDSTNVSARFPLPLSPKTYPEQPPTPQLRGTAPPKAPPFFSCRRTFFLWQMK